MRGISYMENSDVFLISKTNTYEKLKKNFQIEQSGAILSPTSNNFVNVTSNNFELLLPSNEIPIGTEITVIDISGNFLDKGVKLLRNGKKIMNREEDILLDVNFFRNTFLYSGDSFGWVFMF